MWPYVDLRKLFYVFTDLDYVFFEENSKGGKGEAWEEVTGREMNSRKKGGRGQRVLCGSGDGSDREDVAIH